MPSVTRSHVSILTIIPFIDATWIAKEILQSCPNLQGQDVWASNWMKLLSSMHCFHLMCLGLVQICPLPKYSLHQVFPCCFFSHDRCTPFHYRCSILKVSTCKINLFPSKGSFYACIGAIMLSFSMTSLKVVLYIVHLVFYVQQTQPFKYTCILELSSTTIWPNEMTIKWYIHSYHVVIK